MTTGKYFDDRKPKGTPLMEKWNHYVCPRCKGITIAKHEDEGVTPFFLNCRATPGCLGLAESRIYRCSQDDNQRPDVVWYRPASELEAREEIARTVQAPYREATLEHWRMGGALMRELPRTTH